MRLHFTDDERLLARQELADLGISESFGRAAGDAYALLAYLMRVIQFSLITHPNDRALRQAAAVYATWRTAAPPAVGRALAVPPVVDPDHEPDPPAPDPAPELRLPSGWVADPRALDYAPLTLEDLDRLLDGLRTVA